MLWHAHMQQYKGFFTQIITFNIHNHCGFSTQLHSTLTFKIINMYMYISLTLLTVKHVLLVTCMFFLSVVVVTVAKIARGGSLPTGKIVLTPKVLPPPAPQTQLCTPVDSNRVFFSSIPSQPANIIVPTSQQTAVEGVPITVNPPPRIVRPLHQQLPANLSIAPKQLVLITAGTESGQQLATSLTPSTITFPLVQQTPSATTIPLSSLTNVHTVQAAVQAPPPKPAVIHGVLPSKKSDGTVSYLPIKFTKPALASPVVASLSTSTTTLGSPILSGGGVTIVIPSAATAASSSTQNVQLMAAAPQAGFHIATTVATPSTSSTLAHF